MVVGDDLSLELEHVSFQVIDPMLSHFGFHVACLFLALFLILFKRVAIFSSMLHVYRYLLVVQVDLAQDYVVGTHARLLSAATLLFFCLRILGGFGRLHDFEGDVSRHFFINDYESQN